MHLLTMWCVCVCVCRSIFGPEREVRAFSFTQAAPVTYQEFEINVMSFTRL